VLVLGLQPRGTSPLETYLRAAAEQRHPVVLSLHDVERLTAFSTAPVFVCENPSVLERAAAEGVGCALICTEGRPHVAAWRLLIRLAETGASLQVQAITRPERYLLIAATGDELLDWREMVAFYAGALQIVIEGSDHGLSDFAVYLDTVLGFADAAGRRLAVPYGSSRPEADIQQTGVRLFNG
jgi:hypothetical protein